VISIVDDDESVREAMEARMRSLGFHAETFPSAGDFLVSPVIERTSCLIADINMPGMTGIELHRHLVNSGYGIPTILMTAYLNKEERIRALADGIKCYLAKPFEDAELLRCVRSSLSSGTG
jgi:FixJ family two-component response regulator